MRKGVGSDAGAFSDWRRSNFLVSPSPFRRFAAPSLSHKGRGSSMPKLPLPLWEREGAHRESDGKGEGDTGRILR